MTDAPPVSASRLGQLWRTLEEPLPWENSSLLRGDAAAVVAGLKEKLDQDVMILGSGELVRSLMGSDLIDAYTLLIHPLVLVVDDDDMIRENIGEILKLVGYHVEPLLQSVGLRLRRILAKPCMGSGARPKYASAFSAVPEGRLYPKLRHFLQPSS